MSRRRSVSRWDLSRVSKVEMAMKYEVFDCIMFMYIAYKQSLCFQRCNKMPSPTSRFPRK